MLATENAQVTPTTNHQQDKQILVDESVNGLFPEENK